MMSSDHGSDRSGETIRISVLVHFATHFGQRLLLTGSLSSCERLDDIPRDGGPSARIQTQCWLRFEADGRWRGVFGASRASTYTYAYAVATPAASGADSVEAEWGPPREIDVRHLPVGCVQVELRDAWRPHAWATQLLRPLVTACVFQRRQGVSSATAASSADAVAGTLSSGHHVALHMSEARVPAHATLMVVGSCAALGQWDVARALRMSDAAYPTWCVDFTVQPTEWPVEYKYLLQQPDGSVLWEDGSNRTLKQPEYASRAQLAAEGAYLRSLGDTTVHAPSTDVVVDENKLLLRATDELPLAARAAALRVRKPSSSASISAIATLADAEDVEVLVSDAPAPPRSVALLSPPASTPVFVRQHDMLCRGEGFKWKGAGFSVPLFSLRTHASGGVGEYTDLPLLIDAALAAGMRVIHMLPVNDTGVYMDLRDSCPYNVISAHALHPIYINLQQLGRTVNEETGTNLSEQLLERIASAQQQLNGGAMLSTPPPTPASMRRTTSETRFSSLHEQQPLDYDAVLSLKLALLREVYRGAGAALLHGRGFGRWFRDNRTWLQPYALFCFMRELHGVGDPACWGSRKTITSAVIASMTDVSHFYYASIGFHYMVQYCAHVQLLHASAYARDKGVMLAVDIPAGMPRASVDAWSSTNLFMPGVDIGAPPDAFAVDGQVWNAAPFDWAAGEDAVLAWWRARLAHLAVYFTAARICHIETLFRTFVVPEGAVCGRGGVFQPSRGFTSEELLRLSDSLPELQRLTQPHIREWTCRAALGPQYIKVATRFMKVDADGSYSFLEEFNTERKLREALQRTADEHLIIPLAQLLNNRVLITRVSAAPSRSITTTYHPSVSMPSLTAYLELSHTERGTLDALYATYFGRETHEAWRATGLRRLRALLHHSPMLLFGDDFGMPGDFTSIERFVGIAGTRSHRVPVGSTWGNEVRFVLPSSFEPETLAIPSTVDMAPLRSWWEEDTALAAKFVYALRGDASGEQAAPTSVAAVTDVIRAYLNSPSALVALLWQDATALDARAHASDPHAERINVPAVAAHYWRWRMSSCLEDVLASTSSGGMLAVLRRLVEAAHRHAA